MSQEGALSSSETKQETMTQEEIETMTLANSLDETCQPERVNKLVEEAQSFMQGAPSGSIVGCDGRVYIPTANYLHIPTQTTDLTDNTYIPFPDIPYDPDIPPWIPQEPWAPSPSSNTYTWAGNTLNLRIMPVTLYFIGKNVTSYVDALDSIEGIEGMQGIRRACLLWKGDETSEKNGLLIERDIGSEPLVSARVGGGGMYSTVKLGTETTSSIVGEFIVCGVRHICVFSSICVESVETDFDTDKPDGFPMEELELVSPAALPWKSTESILQEVE